MSKFRSNITQEDLKKHLSYCAETGVFTRNLPHKGGSVGDVAGTVKDGYCNIYVCGTYYRAHRLAWLYAYGVMPDRHIDHINGNKLDNRICNLRLATASENMLNVLVTARNRSGQRGVFFDKARNCFRVEAQLQRKKHFLGRFKSFEQAKEVYVEFAKKHHGEFLAQGIM